MCLRCISHTSVQTPDSQPICQRLPAVSCSLRLEIVVDGIPSWSSPAAGGRYFLPSSFSHLGPDASRAHTLFFPALKVLHLPGERVRKQVVCQSASRPQRRVQVFIFQRRHPQSHQAAGLAQLATRTVKRVLLVSVSLSSSQPFSLAHMSALPRHTSFSANLSVAALVKSHISC